MADQPASNRILFDVFHLFVILVHRPDVPIVTTTLEPESRPTVDIDQPIKDRRIQLAPPMKDFPGEWPFQFHQESVHRNRGKIGRHQQVDMFRHYNPGEESVSSLLPGGFQMRDETVFDLVVLKEGEPVVT